ncbi:MAG: hypothetical protein HQ595_03815, partial [Candidatus Omnitrophica bacterium]|nr:hypothetical protein [Candidatus Omnitrophota bacterium]
MKAKTHSDCAIIIQARMSSSRFPGKMMSALGGMPLVEYMYRRCSQSSVAKAVIATSEDRADEALYSY